MSTCTKAMKEATARYYRKNIAYRLFVSTQLRAKAAGIEHTITKEDIKIPKKCPFLGVELTNHPRGHPDIRNNPSVDRIDPTKGYVPGNIRVISWKANSMKQDASWEELVTFAKAILKEEEFLSI